LTEELSYHISSELKYPSFIDKQAWSLNTAAKGPEQGGIYPQCCIFCASFHTYERTVERCASLLSGTNLEAPLWGKY
jgi:hypothetical protein